MSKKDNDSLVFMSGIILGSVVGAAVATLFAPAAGNETRQKVALKGKKALDDVKEGAQKVSEKLAPTVENLRQEFDEKFEDLKKGFEKGVKKGEYSVKKKTAKQVKKA